MLRVEMTGLRATAIPQSCTLSPMTTSRPGQGRLPALAADPARLRFCLRGDRPGRPRGLLLGGRACTITSRM